MESFVKNALKICTGTFFFKGTTLNLSEFLHKSFYSHTHWLHHAFPALPGFYIFPENFSYFWHCLLSGEPGLEKQFYILNPDPKYLTDLLWKYFASLVFYSKQKTRPSAWKYSYLDHPVIKYIFTFNIIMWQCWASHKYITTIPFLHLTITCFSLSLSPQESPPLGLPLTVSSRASTHHLVPKQWSHFLIFVSVTHHFWHPTLYQLLWFCNSFPQNIVACSFIIACDYRGSWIQKGLSWKVITRVSHMISVRYLLEIQSSGGVFYWKERTIQGTEPRAQRPKWIITRQ